MRRSTRRRIFVVFLVLFLTAGLAGFLFVYYDPFWLVERATDVYLWKQGVHHREILVDGYRIHYLEAAPRTAGPEKPIVLVHGLGARASDWAALTPALARHGYHVYALDLLGYGRSDKPFHGDYSLEAEEHIVSGFVDELHLQQPDLAGWSMGGWIAAKLALDQPKKVRRLLLYDTAGIYMPVDFPTSLFTPTDATGLRTLLSRIEPDQPFVHLPGFAIPGLLRRFGRSAWMVDSSLASMLNGREILDFRLHRLKMPVFVLWGTEDNLIPVSSGERIHELVPQSTLVEIGGCGHLAIAECAGQAIPPTLRFLDAEPALPPSVLTLPAKPR